jgi:hypothetical protein
VAGANVRRIVWILAGVVTEVGLWFLGTKNGGRRQRLLRHRRITQHTALQNDWSSPACGCIRKLKMLTLIQIVGTLCTGMSLERPEPWEGQPSRTFLRGTRAG